MFLWFDIEKNKNEWNSLLNTGYEFLFNNYEYLILNKPRNSILSGIITEDNQIKIGGILHSNRQVYEIFMFPLNVTPDFVNDFLKWVKQSGIRKVIIHSFARGIEQCNQLNFNYNTTKRLELIADESYFRNFSKSSLHNTHRRTINKFEQKNFELRKIERFFILHLLSSFLYKVKRKPYLLSGWKSLIKELLYIVKLNKLLKSHEVYVLYSIVDINNKKLSYALILESGSCAYYMLGASTSDGYKIRASVYLMWMLLNKYCKEGVEFNMGGVNISNNSDKGVYRFKKQFGLHEFERISIQVDL